MRLVSAVLGFVLRKALLGGALLVVLFLAHLLIATLVPNLQKAEADRERLEQVTEERQTQTHELQELRRAYEQGRAEAQSKAIEKLTGRVKAEVATFDRRVSDQRSKIAGLVRDQDRECRLREKVIDFVAPGPSCDDARQAVNAAKRTLRTLERSLGEAEAAADVLGDPELTHEQKLEKLGERVGGSQELAAEQREIEAKEAQLNDLKAEEERLTEAQESGAGWVVKQWAHYWKWLLGIVLLLILMPVVLRTVSYFLLMPLVTRAQKPLQLAAEPEHAAATLQSSPAARTLPIRLRAGEMLSARSEYVRPVQGTVRSQLLYDWSAPFISFAAGLHSLSRITGDEDGTEATLATPDDPNSYLMRIDFNDHPGVVMRPTHVVGVIGTPVLQTRWRWGIQSLATWQVRYIMFAGTGSLIVQGTGDVVATSPGDKTTKMEQHLMMGFDSRLTARINRTEVFWPYLRGKTPLVDDEFTGPHPLFWQKSSTGEHSTPIAKTFNAVFSGLGKLLGF